MLEKFIIFCINNDIAYLYIEIYIWSGKGVGRLAYWEANK